MDEFVAAFEESMRELSFCKAFNGYYDSKNPLPFDLEEEAGNMDAAVAAPNLFSLEKVELVYTSIALQNDIQLLSKIANKEVILKTFDYDGNRFTKKEAAGLLLTLKEELEQVEENIRMNDKRIFQYFQEKEKALQKEPRLVRMYQEFFSFDKDFDQKAGLYTQLLEATHFIHFTTPFDVIRTNFLNLLPLERTLKESIQEILSDEKFESEINDEIKESFDMYLSKDWQYFGNDQYFDKD